MSRLIDFELPLLDAVAKARIEAGVTAVYEGYNGSPHSRVTSLAPFEEEKYGILRNTAPHLVGPVAVYGFVPLNELWPGVVIIPIEETEPAKKGLFVAGVTPYEYQLVARAVMSA